VVVIEANGDYRRGLFDGAGGTGVLEYFFYIKIRNDFFVSVQCCLRYIVARARSMFNVVS